MLLVGLDCYYAQTSSDGTDGTVTLSNNHLIAQGSFVQWCAMNVMTRLHAGSRSGLVAILLFKAGRAQIPMVMMLASAQACLSYRVPSSFNLITCYLGLFGPACDQSINFYIRDSILRSA